MEVVLHLKIRPPFTDIFEADYKYKIIVASRRIGKTYASAQYLIQRMIEKPNQNGLWIDVRQANLDKYVERYFRLLLGDLYKYCNYHTQKKILKFWNGSYIDFASAENPTANEGFQYNYMVLNEAGNILKNPSLWTNTLGPMAKGENARVIFIGTPRGKNYFWDLYKQQNYSSEYKSWKLTAYDSPFWNEDELLKLKTTLPELAWKQEYMADFIDGAGIVFRNIRDIATGSVQTYNSDNEYIMGIDLAKHEDFTVISIFDRNKKQQVYMDRFNELDWGLQKTRILNLWKQWGQPNSIIDSTGVGDSVYDDLRNAGMNVSPFRFSQKSKNQIVSNLMVAFENKELIILDNDVQTNELESFEYEVSRFGNVSYNAPSGQHDDCCMSLCLAWELVRSQPVINISFVDFEEADEDF